MTDERRFCEMVRVEAGLLRCRRAGCARELPTAADPGMVWLFCRSGEEAAPDVIDTFDLAPCVHRGETLRTAVCERCGPDAGKTIEIRRCELHGECARRKWKAGSHRQSDGRPVAFCLTCDDQSPPTSPAVTPSRIG